MGYENEIKKKMRKTSLDEVNMHKQKNERRMRNTENGATKVSQHYRLLAIAFVCFFFAFSP